MTTERLTFLDGLRGIAALAVCIHHITEAIANRGYHAVEYVHRVFLSFGAMGVDVFFVLSGYVIAMTMDGKNVDGKYVLCFVGRRSVRLDPSYLGSILIVVLITWAARAGTQAPVDLPTAPQLVAHAFYLQNILGFKELNPVLWTLCMEVQFYLVLVVMLFAAQRIYSHARVGGELYRKSGVVVFCVLLAVASAIIHGDWYTPPIRHLFVEKWYKFFLGVAVYWGHKKYIPGHWLLGFVVVVLGISMAGKPNIGDLIGAGTAFLLLKYSHSPTLNAYPIQFLGRISYSLYLLHIPIGIPVISVLNPTAGVDDHGRAVIVGLAAILASIGAAYLFYRLVEEPSARLSRSICRG